MKEELIRVLNYKLNDIGNDIESLNDLNTKIKEEQEKSEFIEKMLNVFTEDGIEDLTNFVRIDKDDFEKSLAIAGEELQSVFNTSSCNYDGLVYLINGINNGISLTLTDEQRNSIRYFIEKLGDCKKENDSAIEGHTLVKSRYEISDVDELEKKKDEYNKVLSELENGEYVKNTELLNEAIKFSSLSPEETIDILSFVLEYNANLHEEGKETHHEVEETPKEETVEEEAHEEKEEVPEVDIPEPEMPEEYSDLDTEFHFNEIDNDKLFDLPNIKFDDEETDNNEYSEPEVETSDKVEESEEEISNEEKEEPVEATSEDTPKETSETEMPEYQEYTPQEETNEEVSIPDELQYVPETEDNQVEESPIEDNVTLNEESVETGPFEPEIEEEKEPIDNDFKDVVISQEDYDDRETQEEEKTSTRELQKIFGKYGIEENTILNELIDGNVNEYQNTLDSLKDNGILEYFRGNRELLVETLLYSNVDVVDKILRIVKEDLSVDDEDYGITLKIVINTIPSVFVKDGGNYDNFVKNVELFKELGINLINLFDFSKEVFIADHENVVKNVDIINKYGFDINYKNAKYFLLIPNIADRLDYYIESVYEDKEKGQTFDGVEYIKEYAAKLNVVTDETIKRLRYASENGKKVFGSKPGSLSGEITNLKVNALDISDEYLNKFFDNEFASLTGDEVREYVKLIHNSSNVGNYSDELDKLNEYRDGMRYNIEGIKVSYNKVVRNYNILRSYGMDMKKALQFAVCYNLVITKDEYDKLNDLLEKIGGNV